MPAPDPATGTDIRDAGWYGEDLTGQEHTASGGDWSFTALASADLTRATLTGVRLHEADLTRLRAAGDTLRDLDLSAAELHDADLSGADLRGSDLSAVDPRDVDLTGAEIDVAQAVVLVSSLEMRVRPDAPE